MASTRDTAFLLTPPGAAAIAVVRVAGPAVADFLSRHFSRPPRLGHAVHGELRDGSRIIDDPVVVLVRPDVADVNLHGGPWVVRSALDLLSRNGFDVVSSDPSATPLLEAAIDGDDPLEREVLAYLPLARTELAVRALLAQPAAWRTFLASKPSREQVDAVLADRTMERLLYPPRVAIVGAANVGKSTLANRLFGQERSITADMPGTTRDWVGELADIGGVAVMLVDTPGLRATEDEIERRAIDHSHAQVAVADVVVVVVDAARAWDHEQRAPVERFVDAIVVVNKVDRPAAWDAGVLAGRDHMRIVATAGDGVAELEKTILRRLGCDAIATADIRAWTGRQRDVLRSIEATSFPTRLR